MLTVIARLTLLTEVECIGIIYVKTYVAASCLSCY